MTRPASKKIASVVQAVLDDLGSDASRRGYASDWRNFCAWLDKEGLAALKVTPKDVKRYVVHLAKEGKASRTRGRHLSVIREIYRAMVEEELLDVNPAREVKNVKHGKSAKPVTWLEEDQLQKMLGFGTVPVGVPCRNACGRIWTNEKHVCCTGGPRDGELVGFEPDWTDRRDRMCVQLLAGTGRRRSEVARMQVEDFDEHGVTGIVKGGAEKTAPVPSWLKEELKSWLDFAKIKSGPVLPRSPDDLSAITGDTVYAIVKRVALACGIPPEKISPHGLRRTLATLSERKGVSLGDIQTQLGHSARSTTEGYLHGSRKVEEAPGEWMGEMVRSKISGDSK